MDKLKRNTKWHPTILCQQAQRASVQGLFTLDEDRHEAITKNILSSEVIPLEEILRRYHKNPYRYVHLTRTQRTHYLLGEEYTYWAEQQMPLLILEATGKADESMRIVTKCLPANLPLGPFKAFPKEFIVSYLLGDQEAVFNFLTHKTSRP